MHRAIRRPFPGKRLLESAAQPVVNRRVTFQQIESRRQAGDTMSENAHMQLRRPRQNIPRGYRWARQQMIEHSIEGGGGNGGLAIKSLAAAALADQGRSRDTAGERQRWQRGWVGASGRIR